MDLEALIPRYIMTLPRGDSAMLQTFDSYSDAKEEMLECTTGLLEVCQYLGLADKQKMLDYWQQKIMDNRFVLLVLGDFNRGKSTLINALLGEKILPAKMVPTTGNINTVKYGDRPKALVSFRDENREPEEISFAKFREIVQIDLNNEDSEETRVYFSKNPVKHIEVFYPLDLCRNGVEIVDSPGLNDDQSRSEVTKDYISKADVAIILLSAETFLAKNESEFIEGLIKSGFRNFFFVVNFIDLVDDEDELEERARTKLTELINDIPLKIFFLSADQALEGKIAGNENDIEMSRFRGFEKGLTNFLVKERGKAFLESSKATIADICNTIENTISQRSELLKQPLEDLEAKDQQIAPRIHALRDKKAKILKTVGVKKEKVKSYFVNEFNDMMRRLVTVQMKLDSKEWESKARIVLRKKEYEKCAEEYFDQARKYVEDKTAEWSKHEVIPKIEGNIRDLCIEIGDDAKEIAFELDRVRLAIHPDFEPVETENTVTVVERFLTAGALFIFNPVAALAGGIFGAKGAVENFSMQLGAGLLLATIGLLTPGAIIGIGVIITVGQVIWKSNGKREKIRDSVVKNISGKLYPPPKHVETKLLESIEDAFDNFARALDEGIESKLQDVEGQLKKVIEEKTLKGEAAEQALDQLGEQESKLSGIRLKLSEISH